MIVIVSSQGKTLDSKPNPHFGRTPFFIKYDLELNEWEALNNPAIAEPGGAGVAAAQFMIDNQAEAVISGRFGPNAAEALKSAGLQMWSFDKDCDSVSKVIDLFKQGLLNQG